MAQVELAIDIDTTDVTAADAAMSRFETRLRSVSGGFTGVAGASGKADAGVRRVADATSLAEQRTASAIGQYQKLTAVWASLAAVAGGAMIGGLVRLSDAYTEIENKLRVVSGEQGNVNALFEQLLDVANRTRTPIEAMATLYQRVSMAANELGASQQDVLQFSENIGKALALQGGSAEAASGALMQLSQALGGGTVRAEEFNSILEGAFPIAQAAARGIDEAGGSVARLRALVIDGKVSSDEFFQAILSQTAELENAFAKASPTIGGAFTVLQNNMLALSRETQGIMSLLAEGIILVGDNLERLAAYAATAAVIFGGRLVAGLVASAVATGTLTGALTVLRGSIIRTGIGALVIAAGEMVHQFLRLVKATGGWGEALALLGEVAAGVWEGIKTSAGAIPPALAGIWSRIKSDFLLMAADIGASWVGLLEQFNVRGVLDGMIADAAASVRDLIAESAAAYDQSQAQLGAAADAARAGFDQANAALDKLKVSVADTAGGLDGAAGAAGAVAGGLGDAGSEAAKAAGGAKKLADELARARDVVGEQVREHQRLTDQINGAAVGTGYVADETQRLADALADTGTSMDDFLKTVGMTRKEYAKMLGDSEKMSAQMDHQKAASAELVNSLRGLAFGTMTGAEGIGGAIGALTDGAFGVEINDAFKKAGDTLSDSFSKAMKGLGGATGLGDFATASIGTGIGIAATGALQGNAQQIGSGIGSAIGGAFGGKMLGFLGAAAGPIGMVLGGLAGSVLGGLFGGGDEDKWKRASGTAFSGTTFEAAVTTDRTVNTATDQGLSTEGRIAFQGVKALLKDFNAEIAEFVKAAGGEVARGSRVVVDQNRALKAITGTIDEADIAYKGEAGKKAAAEISAKVSEIMGLAASLVQDSGVPLTQAQTAWREVQERFSKENMEILKSLGFTAREMLEAQSGIRRDLAQGFNKEMLDALVDTGDATRKEIDQWRGYELQALKERRQAAMATAREIGASTALVASSFRAQRREIVGEWREMLDEMTEEVANTSGERARAAEALNLQTLQQIANSGDATRVQLARWREAELASLEERRVASVKNAREIGASVNLVNTSFTNQKDAIIDRWRELLKGIIGEVDKIGANREAARGSNKGALDVLVESGRATKHYIDQWKGYELAALEERRIAAVKNAREVGGSVKLVNSAFTAQKDQVLARWRQLLKGLVDEVEKTPRLARITRRERLDFTGSALDELVQGGNTKVLGWWRDIQIKLLDQQRKAQVAEAKRLGVETTLIHRLYGQKIADVEKEYAERRYQSAIDAAAKAIDRLNSQLGNLESRRSEVLQELTRRAEEARRAEMALADARAQIASGALNPGGPMDQFKALQAQFGAAIRAAMGGDADAASRAGGLASELLQSGRGVFASGRGYADLFKQVNSQLLMAQKGFDKSADKIEKRLDATTFVETSEKSTRALLTALGRLNTSIEKVEDRIRHQTRQQQMLEQRKRVAS